MPDAIDTRNRPEIQPGSIPEPAAADEAAALAPEALGADDGAEVTAPDAGTPIDAGAVIEDGDAYARQTGYVDGYQGHRDHAARYPAGEPGHGDYWLGHAAGERDRDTNRDLGAAAAEEVTAPEPPRSRRRRQVEDAPA